MIEITIKGKFRGNAIEDARALLISAYLRAILGGNHMMLKYGEVLFSGRRVDVIARVDQNECALIEIVSNSKNVRNVISKLKSLIAYPTPECEKYEGYVFLLPYDVVYEIIQILSMRILKVKASVEL